MSQSQQHKRYTRIRIQDEYDIQMLYPLILDYIRQPELALSVKEFVFCSPLPDYVPRWTRRPVIVGAGEDARDVSGEHSISQFVTSLGIEGSEKSDWVGILTCGRWDRLFSHYAAAILLMLCPNIEILKYEDCSGVVDAILLRNNYGLFRTTHLQRLRDVTLLPTSNATLGDERFYVRFDILAFLRLFHRLPAIESVSVDAVESDNDGGYVYQFPPETSNLKRIHVGHSAYGTNVIGPLIMVPKRLEEFTFTTGGRNILDGGQTFRCAKTIGKALHMHKSSLRMIDIDIDEFIGGEEEIDDASWDSDKDEWFYRDMEISPGPLTTARLPDTREYGATIGSMHDFESLTHLSIGIGLLLGGCSWRMNENEEAPFRLVDALPKSLEYLLIRGYERGKVARYDGQIDEFLLHWRDRLPSLREVHGIDETIPIALSIEDPDENYDELWQRNTSGDGWEEALS